MGAFSTRGATVLLSLFLVLRGQMSSGQTITCHADGFVCSSNCSVVYQCLGTSPNYNLITLERCDSSKHYYCSSSLGRCSSTFASTCPPPDYQFQCTSIGVFPDPYDCAVFHMCHSSADDDSGIADSQERCESGWLYSAEHHSCRIEANICQEDPVPACRAASQIGALTSNPSYYYLCSTSSQGYLYPTLYQCPHGGHFNNTQGRCVTH